MREQARTSGGLLRERRQKGLPVRLEQRAKKEYTWFERQVSELVGDQLAAVLDVLRRPVFAERPANPAAARLWYGDPEALKARIADFARHLEADSSVERLALKFNALGEQFNFEFERSHPIFEPGLTIKMAGRVREHTEKTHVQA